MMTNVLQLSISSLESKLAGRFIVEVGGLQSPEIVGVGTIETPGLALTTEVPALDNFTLRVTELESKAVYSVDIDMVDLAPSTSVVVTEGLLIYLSLSVAKPFSYDEFVNKGLDYVSTVERPWYFKGSDIYSLLKKTFDDMRRDSTLIVKMEPTADKVIAALNKTTESVLKNYTSMTIEENFDVITEIDNILSSSLMKTDDFIDCSRTNVASSVKELKGALAAKSESMLSKVTSTASSVKASIFDKWAEIRSSASARYESTKSNAQSRATACYESAKDSAFTNISNVQTTATPYIDAAIVASHPYLVKASEISEPYVNKAKEIADPLISKAVSAAEPVLTQAMGILAENKYAGPILDTSSNIITKATDLVVDAKVYYDNKTEVKSVPEVQQQQVEAE